MERLHGGLLDRLADPLDIPGIIHELDVVVPEILLHGRSPQGLHFRLPLAEIQLVQRAHEYQPGETAQLALKLQEENARLRRSEERRVGKECRSRWSPNH